LVGNMIVFFFFCFFVLFAEIDAFNPKLPLIYSEYNSGLDKVAPGLDTSYAASFIIKNVFGNNHQIE